MNSKIIEIVLIMLLSVIFSCKNKLENTVTKQTATTKKTDTTPLSKDQEKFLESVVTGNQNLNKGASNFEITALEGWEKKNSTLNGLLSTILFAPKKNNEAFRINVNVVTEKVAPDIDLQEYASNSKTELSKTFVNFEKIADNETSLNGLNAHHLIFTHKLQNFDFKMEQYYILNNNIAYVITCSATQQTFNKYKTDFDKIVNSFQLIDAKK
jgi:hypothetical protein